MPAIEPQTLVAEFAAQLQQRDSAAANVAWLARIDALALEVSQYDKLAELLLHAGHLPTAVALLNAALARFPDAIELHYRHGNALRMSGLDEQGERELRGVLREQPGHSHAAYSLAYMLRERGRTQAAAEVVATLWSNAQLNAPQLDADSALIAINFLVECAAYVQALPLAREAQRRWPRDARIAARAGTIALALGKFEEAAAALRGALDGDPTQSIAWLRLAYCRRFVDAQDADVARFRRGWNNIDLAPTARTCAGFALGKALDDIGDYAHAAQVLREANAQARTATSWRSEDWRRMVEARLHAAPFARPPAPTGTDFVPVFIVGLPRTGTTLVANALGRFAGVRDRGELNWIAALYAHLRDRQRLRDPRALSSVAAMITAQMRRDDNPARFYIDKNPLNFRYVDFIAALFPNARIIHCRRASRDTALSLWMQHFAHEDLGFAYDFSTIAEVEQGCKALMAHWRDDLGIKICELDYESFVADPAHQQQRAAAYLGLESEAAPETSPDDAVATASVWQVRQAVYTHAVARWRHYAPYVPELLALFPEPA